MNYIDEEYLTLFSNTGEINVSVFFKDFTGQVSDKKMQPNEISKLLDSKTGRFITKLYFDGWPFSINSIKIDMVKNKLIITAKKIEGYDYNL